MDSAGEPPPPQTGSSTTGSQTPGNMAAMNAVEPPANTMPPVRQQNMPKPSVSNTHLPPTTSTSRFKVTAVANDALNTSTQSIKSIPSGAPVNGAANVIPSTVPPQGPTREVEPPSQLQINHEQLNGTSHVQSPLDQREPVISPQNGAAPAQNGKRAGTAEEPGFRILKVTSLNSVNSVGQGSDDSNGGSTPTNLQANTTMPPPGQPQAQPLVASMSTQERGMGNRMQPFSVDLENGALSSTPSSVLSPNPMASPENCGSLAGGINPLSAKPKSERPTHKNHETTIIAEVNMTNTIMLQDRAPQNSAPQYRTSDVNRASQPGHAKSTKAKKTDMRWVKSAPTSGRRGRWNYEDIPQQAGSAHHVDTVAPAVSSSSLVQPPTPQTSMPMMSTSQVHPLQSHTQLSQRNYALAAQHGSMPSHVQVDAQLHHSAMAHMNSRPTSVLENEGGRGEAATIPGNAMPAEMGRRATISGQDASTQIHRQAGQSVMQNNPQHQIQHQQAHLMNHVATPVHQSGQQGQITGIAQPQPVTSQPSQHVAAPLSSATSQRLVSSSVVPGSPGASQIMQNHHAFDTTGIHQQGEQLQGKQHQHSATGIQGLPPTQQQTNQQVPLQAQPSQVHIPGQHPSQAQQQPQVQTPVQSQAVTPAQSAQVTHQVAQTSQTQQNGPQTHNQQVQPQVHNIAQNYRPVAADPHNSMVQQQPHQQVYPTQAPPPQQQQPYTSQSQPNAQQQRPPQQPTPHPTQSHSNMGNPQQSLPTGMPPQPVMPQRLEKRPEDQQVPMHVAAQPAKEVSAPTNENAKQIRQLMNSLEEKLLESIAKQESQFKKEKEMLVNKIVDLEKKVANRETKIERLEFENEQYQRSNLFLKAQVEKLERKEDKDQTS